MANRPAPALLLRDGDREELLRLTRSSRAPAGLARRARIVLLAAAGVSNTTIADGVGVSRPTVIAWRDRYQAKGIAGLHDEDRSGRPRRIDRAKVIAVTLAPPPKKYGVTHWSSRLLARHLKISDHAVASIWREHGVRPWRSKSFRFSTDPELEAKVVDVVGLYLDPPENAIVLSIDEKSQTRAPDPTAPGRPPSAAPDRPPLPRLRPPRHHNPVRRPGGRHRQGHRRAQAPPPPQRVPRVPQAGRTRLPARSRRRAIAPGDGQLRSP